MDAEPLVLPAAWVAPRRAGIPLLASLVPVLGAVALWLVTGSVLSLWLALLGPLIAAATLLDASRGTRRDRRRAQTEADVARERVIAEVAVRHESERERLRATHADVATLATCDDEVWRAVPARSEALVVGAGARASGVRVTGGEGDAASTAVRARAATLEAAPITVPLGAGVAVVGRAPVAPAVVRALVIQVCSALPPGRLRIVGALSDENAWAEELPHRRAREGIALGLIGPDEAVPAGCDIVIAHARVPVPARCAAVLSVTSPVHAQLDYGGEMVELEVEALSAVQAAEIARALAQRALTVLDEGQGPSGPVLLGPLLGGALGDARQAHEGLRAVIATRAGRSVTVDLVSDGPHAVVAGVTGSGKSELLITWILSLCAGHSTAEVTFLLADFKGGTAFDALAEVPHVTGVITDLDGSGARRAIESLRAEVRWREGELARVAARDIRDPRVQLPRLVIVVDEFAALVGTHPELQAVFTDVAARGRALGMHLILGTQRVAGVIREALLTNCPLRLSLRVIDEADSRAVVGSPEAAALPGGPDGRGFALVRRAGDTAPEAVRVALSTPDDIATVCDRSSGAPPRRPWLPDLPATVPLAELRSEHRRVPGEILLGLIDEPDRQRQHAAVLALDDRGLLVVGGAGTGKTALLRTIAAQCAGDLFRITSAGEQAWDAVARLAAQPAARGSVVVIDDLDALTVRLPQDYAHVILERIEQLIRGAGDAGVLVVVSARRLTGAVGRVVELVPRRALLAMSSRAEYIGVGGDPAHHLPSPPPGRGRLDGQAIQFAWCDPSDVGVGSEPGIPPEPPVGWMPAAPLTGFVARRSAATRAVLARWQDAGAAIVRIDDAPHVGDAATAGIPVAVVGEPDEWQRHWGLLARIRGEHDLVIDAACAQEYRIVAGERDLPPYCEPGRRRAWLRREDCAAQRIVLPCADAAGGRAGDEYRGEAT
ncbi:FtsK/SpoIIIE domain-containing protein [Microbacterium rhizomatis]|uniref:FtsK/SpoIIIE domain-containing protein n=1 Tax=Microbacterium rhizomatis TaxID=1631477 RepID=UPI0014789934|nr:FtsK/SpoIIIE domain-containing protein [Microbacterium rhizomatis]